MHVRCKRLVKLRRCGRTPRLVALYLLLVVLELRLSFESRVHLRPQPVISTLQLAL